MYINVVLAVGLDAWQLASQNSQLRSAGYVVVSATSIREAIEQFKVGDFDVVLLGRSISVEHKERLTDLIRTASSRTPVISIPNSPGDYNSLADGTFRDDVISLFKSVEATSEETPKARTVPAIRHGDVAGSAVYR